MEAQERMLADSAHELRTPVAVMRSSVDVAGLDPRGLDPHPPRIRRATERLTDVVDNVLIRAASRKAPTPCARCRCAWTSWSSRSVRSRRPERTL
ncbi:histidine kinase dimerization/phospho-acceptor domain-containing protein [Streptomyces sp. NPDC058611]|uniref:histidine kinase dimerization/phospho-acceptor domain-containing protein n=1 Tax=unclassified Streptomyces TaxID=2593676 RepID=UPI00365B8FCD